MKIQLLSPLLANQIAAGEVVERPASVVKELIENSIDAGATSVELRLKEGGKRLIHVRDNGEGIAQEDLVLAVSRHATSKIAQLEDLAAIRSLGFRGEALASISAVSHLSLSSKTAQAETAWQLSVAGPDLHTTLHPCAHPQGTSVSIKDLFFNTPARRKFLRATATELGHCDELIKRFALSRFDVGFQLYHDENLQRQFPVAPTLLQKEKRVHKILGQRFIREATYLEMSATSLSLKGWIALPTYSRQQTDGQYFYLNHRMVRDKLLNHAVRQAYAASLPPGRYPAFVLYLDIDPQEVDVNVHPTKHEVRFHQSRLVHDFIVTSLQKALHKSNMTLDVTAGSATPRVSSAPLQPTLPFKSMAFSQPVHARQRPNTSATLSFIGIVHQHYALYEIPTGMALIPVAAIYSHFLAKQWYDAWQQQGYLEKKWLLLPQPLTLTPEGITLCQQNEAALQKLGIVFSVLGEDKVFLRALPEGMRQLSAKMLQTTLTARDQPFFSELAQTADLEGDSQWLRQLDETLLSHLSPVIFPLSREIKEEA